MFGTARGPALLTWGALLLAFAAIGCGGASSSAPARPSDGGAADARDAPAVLDSAMGSGGLSGTGGAAAAGTGVAVAGSGGSTGAGTGGAGGAGGGASTGCFIDLSLVSPQTDDNLFSGSKAQVRMRAQVYSPGTKPPVWRWSVEYRDTVPFTPIPTTVTPDPTNPLVVTAEFPVKEYGRYQVLVHVDTGAMCERPKALVVNAPGSASFLLRVTPPSSLNLEIPVQERPIKLDMGMVPRVSIPLARGTRRSFSVLAPQGGERFIPAYLRISVVPSGVALEGHTNRGPVDVFLLPRTTYDVLIVPDGDVAPIRLSASAEMSSSLFNPVRIDPGTLVRGSLRNSDGAPVVGARIVLREGARPSTLGVSDSVGRFSLWTRPGAQSAVIVPPVDSGLPEANVAAAPGILVDTQLTDLTMTWAAVDRVPFSVAVKLSDGITPAVGARVRVESEPDVVAVQQVGTVRVSGGQTTVLPALGGSRQEVVTGAEGVAAFPLLPLGPYKITAVPPPDHVEPLGLTTRHIILSRSGMTETVRLVRPLTLSGALLPTANTKGVRVIARDKSTGLMAPMATATAGEGGEYTLSVSPDRHYQLVADPPAGSTLARTVLETKDPIFTDARTRDYVVAPGVVFLGRINVEGDEMRPVGRALVQVFCVGASLDCPDPEIALAETVTIETGEFNVTLPAAR